MEMRQNLRMGQRLLQGAFMGFIALHGSSLAQAAEIKLGVRLGVEKPSEVFDQYTTLIKCIDSELKTQGKDLTLKVDFIAGTLEKLQEAVKSKAFDIYAGTDTNYIIVRDKMKEKIQVLVVPQTGGKIRIPGILFTTDRSGLKSIEDIKKFEGDQKKVLLLQSKQSPAYFLLTQKFSEHGITQKHFKRIEVNPTVRADATLASVLGGNGDMALVFKKLVKKYKETHKEIVELTEIETASFPWFVREEMDPQILSALKKAIINIKDPKCVSGLKIDGFVEAKDSDFNYMREAMKTVPKFEVQ